MERDKSILAKWKFGSTINNEYKFLLNFQPFSNSEIHVDKKAKQIKFGGLGVHLHTKIFFWTQNKYFLKL